MSVKSCLLTINFQQPHVSLYEVAENSSEVSLLPLHLKAGQVLFPQYLLVGLSSAYCPSWWHLIDSLQVIGVLLILENSE